MLKTTTRKLLNYVLKDQNSFVLLDISKSSPARNITFLQSNLQLFPTILRQTIDATHFKSTSVQNLNAYINQVQRLSGKLTDIRRAQISPSILGDEDILSLSKTYQSIKNNIYQQSQTVLTESNKGENLKQLIYVTISLNILDYKLWSRFIKAFITQYKSYSIQDKNQILEMFLLYLSKYSYTTNKLTNHKFVMRQTHLRDLFDFDYFLQNTRETDLLKKLFKTQLRNALKLIKNRISLIEKIGKSSNFNYHSIRKQFESYIPEIAANIEFFKLNNILEIYSFYQKIFLTPEYFIQAIQAQIIKSITQSELSNDTKIFTSNGLIKIWSFSQTSNKNIYNQFIEPVFTDALNSNKKSVYFWINLTYSLICSDLGEEKLVNGILDKIQSFNKSKYQKNGTYQIIKSYLKLKQLKKSKPLAQIIKERQKKIQNSIQIQKSRIGKQPIQFSPSEQFWRFAMQSVIPAEDIHSSIYIEQYQIDLFVKYRDCYFAIEAEGSYKGPDQNNKLSGKQRIRSQIISSYGVNIIYLSNLQFQHKMFMRFNLINRAQEYLFGLMDSICEQKLCKAQTKSDQ